MGLWLQAIIDDKTLKNNDFDEKLLKTMTLTKTLEMIFATGKSTFCRRPTALWPQAAQANSIMAAGSAGQETPVTPPLNILKIWACDELLCKSYEKNVPPFPLTQYIVRRVGPIINEFCQFYTAGFTYMSVVQVKMTHLM